MVGSRSARRAWEGAGVGETLQTRRRAHELENQFTEAVVFEARPAGYTLHEPGGDRRSRGAHDCPGITRHFGIERAQSFTAAGRDSRNGGWAGAGAQGSDPRGTGGTVGVSAVSG